MNVKELKKLALGLISAKDRDSELRAGMDLYEAIMALPDDPQAEHEDLVEMAREALESGEPFGRLGKFCTLARTVIERFGVREPRKVEMWAVMNGMAVFEILYTKDRAEKYIASLPAGPDFYLVRLTGTEEV